jgi:hypothetical protein
MEVLVLLVDKRLHIGGAADSVPNVSYLGKGATGAGVRLFVEFVMKFAG